MAAHWFETLTGPLSQKKQYRQDKARIEALPEPYGSVAKAMHRYITYFAGVTDGDTLVTMFGELADLWERASLDATPVRDIVGDDPVGFAETFAQAYAGKQWIDKERARFVATVDSAERVSSGASDGEDAGPDDAGDPRRP
jgi:DNA-binding ferritin-like protein (Dps family)